MPTDAAINQQVAGKLREAADLLQQQGKLPTIAPKRFNPSGEAWLPILHTQREA